jgi:hypothetical protein
MSKKNDRSDSEAAAETLPVEHGSRKNHHEQELSGVLRGIAAATRKLLIPAKKAIIAKGPASKQAVRAVGENRPLAFASEGAVAGESMIPRAVYYGAWTLSGAAICADIYNKQDDAPSDKRWNAVFYWTAFHIPASLVVPAVIIHRIVHTVENAVENPKKGSMLAKKAWFQSSRFKAGAPVAAALLSIIPVVPIVDHSFEFIMEPTLGAYLGLTFHHHHHDEEHQQPKEKSKQS